jgi:NADH-quinone oxidoreductase subunit C
MASMTNDEVLKDLLNHFGSDVFEVDEPHGLLTVHTTAARVIDLLLHVRSSATLQMNFLTDITVIHYPERVGEEFSVVYHCHSWYTNVRLRVKVKVPLSAPHIPSAIPVHLSANWMEREAFDFYGIIFEGHPNLVRILNMDEMDYHPMRKEYPLEDPTRRDKVDHQFGR